jgi:histidinol-phosphatase
VTAYSADLKLALELADEADLLTLARFQALDLVVETKPDLTPVSDADKGTERLIRDRLATERPDDGIIGEEFGDQGGSGRRWIIDPIDGTKSFVRGVPVWATLIALADGNDIPVGVVSAPALGRRWWASAGEGAWAGGELVGTPRRLEVSRVSDLEHASLSYSDSTGWADDGAGLRALERAVWRTRAYGDFWSHLLVAEGAVDCAAEPELAVWDIGALVPIVQEAGGRVTTVDGSHVLTGGGAVSTNSVLHDAVLAVLAGH